MDLERDTVTMDGKPVKDIKKIYLLLPHFSGHLSYVLARRVHYAFVPSLWHFCCC